MAGFIKAVRSQAKLRAAIDGPAGSGKTFSGLRLAFALKAMGLATKIAVIDTENNSASLYANEAPDGEPWEFDALNLTRYGPDDFTHAINEAARLKYDCIFIDSLTHAWQGQGGALDLVDQKGGKFQAWKDVTPMHRKMIDTILRSPAHVIATMRSKMEHIMEKDDKGAVTVRKIGLAPIQREGAEYEFTVYGSMDWAHQIKVTKSRCSALQDATTVKPGPTFWAPLVDWLKSAEPSAMVPEEPTVIAPPAPAEVKPTREFLTSLIQATTTAEQLEATRPALRDAMEKKHISGRDGAALKVKFDEHAAKLKATPADPIPT